VLGLWSAALFNLCALLLPLAAAETIRIVEQNRLYTYEPTEAAARQSRAALERAARQLSRTPDAARQWDDNVARALIDGDIPAARGLMLLAPSLLPGAQAGQLRADLRGRNTDAALESAALGQLTRGTRSRYESTVPLLSRLRAGDWAGARQARGSFVVMGDAAAFEAQARAVLAADARSHLPLLLTGLGVSLTPNSENTTRDGVAVLQAALEANALQPSFLEALGALADRAAPQQRFATEARRLAGAGEPQGPVLFSAFRATLNPRELALFNAMLGEIGAMAEAASAPGALTLMRHARSLEDVKRLRLLAQTNPERALALARRAPAESGALPRAGRGALALTGALLGPLALTLACLAGIACAAIATSAHAVGRALATQALYAAPRRRDPAPPPVQTRLVREFRRDAP
jgi:hypothetical protein